MKQKITTKFGTAMVGTHGYYKISSSIEGNNNKLLHRLIWEDFYKMEIPKGYVIHHKNENRLDNCILNLQLMKDSKHRSIHGKHQIGKVIPIETRLKISNALKGRKLSKDLRNKLIDSHDKEFDSKIIKECTKAPLSTKINMSKHQNTSGYFRVTKLKNKECVQGFTWAYKYYDENGKQQQITSVSLKKLKQKVLSKGLDWICYKEDCI